VSTVVLDTDVSSLIIKRQLSSRLAALLADRLLSITFVTVAELRYWVESRPMSRQRLADLITWKHGVVKLPGDEETAEVWGQLSAAARLRGRPRPQNDTWIAASCVSRGLPLATRNVKDFADFAEHHGLVLITD
jgi:predicted nucleic acid-binding protein